MMDEKAESLSGWYSTPTKVRHWFEQIRPQNTQTRKLLPRCGIKLAVYSAGSIYHDTNHEHIRNCKNCRRCINR